MTHVDREILRPLRARGVVRGCLVEGCHETTEPGSEAPKTTEAWPGSRPGLCRRSATIVAPMRKVAAKAPEPAGVDDFQHLPVLELMAHLPLPLPLPSRLPCAASLPLYPPMLLLLLPA